jgi:hypothetical protein
VKIFGTVSKENIKKKLNTSIELSEMTLFNVVIDR